MSTKNTSKNRARLGRGLSSLISLDDQVGIPSTPVPVARPTPPAAPEPEPSADPETPDPNLDQQGAQTPLSSIAIQHIPLDRIRPNPHQPRRSFDDQSLRDLAESIRATGLIQPIVVRPDADAFELVAGERRFRAARIAGLAEIPALVRPDIDSVQQAQMALVENIQREDLNPIDRAQGYRTLIDQLGLTQAELAGRLGEDRSSIANFLRLLDLAEPVRAMVRDSRLSVGHAKLLAGVPDILEQERIAQLTLAQGLSVRNLERLLAEPPQDPQTRLPSAAPSPSAHLADLEKSLARQLGVRVQVRSSAKKGRGKLILHYANLDQFDELLTRLGVQAE